ncbi:Vacuolar protein sorting-associated protein 41-like protein [Erysiphe neolycopersici]|uniref:Vacuolar protein sorting-associated protein 41-like protein n=1 Tax=Erysiphe neolycopersici TaxID=212602 RepID=A0A420HQJ0_9PEZI|nr:Vacuolar protein sorting-associated protein 41-like protein [Erysiphe neolycopersici]
MPTDSDEQASVQSSTRIEVGRHNLNSAVNKQLAHDFNQEEDDTDEDEDEDTEEEEEEPKLKYVRMTTKLGSVYRNGDATSAFVVAGDKMFLGTHNGNVHVALVPSYEFLRIYHAHSASISSISISPFQPPTSSPAPDGVNKLMYQALNRPPSISSGISTTSLRKNQSISAVPNIPSNAIYIATSSIDGNVCIQSLIDVKDVQLRNFGRPVQAVALSPEYKNDKTYISGGLAGNLILTVGGKAGTNSTSATTGTAAATATGWLSAFGLSGNTAKDTILHSGEGTISTIKWSISGKYVVWINEYGVKIMRSNFRLDSADSDFAWKRIGHIDRPSDENWGEMASAWKGKVEWVDLKSLESNRMESLSESETGLPQGKKKTVSHPSQLNTKVEKLLVGWGGTFWIIDIHPGDTDAGIKSDARNRSVGRPQIVKTLNLGCIICGLSLFSSTLLVVLAYPHQEEAKEGLVDENSQEQIKQIPIESTSKKKLGGISRRLKGLPPELCLIDLNTDEEIDSDTLTVSRYERLSASDYHLGILLGNNNIQNVSSRGTFESLTGISSGVWNTTVYPTSLISSPNSMQSNESKGSGSTKSSVTVVRVKRPVYSNKQTAKPGIKIFIHSPYDCILATKRDLSDHLSWLIEHEKFKYAWELLDKHPEIITPIEKPAENRPQTPESKVSNIDNFFDDTSLNESSNKAKNSSLEKEKYRIGELWIQKLININDWGAAGLVCGKVLKTAYQWEKYIHYFVSENKFDEIADIIPSKKLRPPIKSEMYEIVLVHYVTQNRPKAKILLERWSTDLYNIKNVTDTLENQLKYRDVREDSIEDGEVGRDWRIVMESLGRLYIADGHPRESIKCYIKLQNADTALNMIREHHLVDILAEDIPGVILLRVSKQQLDTASLDELKSATSETISLLVNEAHTGLVSPSVVVQQLQEKEMPLYLYFYLSALWRGDGIEEYQGDTREKLEQDSKALVDQFSDLVVHLFSIYDRKLLMEFLKSSTLYTLEKATFECEERDFIPELVYLYSKTGQTKRALYLIIDRLTDVSQAISFAKEQNDSDLWEDLLNYSMDKPVFIRGLLEEVGTAINPITLIRRIPEGLEIQGLREGLKRIIKEYELQHSISYGVAKVLQSEVATTQNILRAGQQRGIRFNVLRKLNHQVDNEISHTLSDINEKNNKVVENPAEVIKKATRLEPGYCVGCHEPFTDQEIEILVGFTCGHVWHLSHLLSYRNDHQPITPPEVNLDCQDEWTVTQSIGAKVTHARLLKDKIRSGCPICTVENFFNRTQNAN